MATARKLPSGNWRVNQFIGMVDGKRKYKSFTAPTKKEAEFLAANYVLDNKQLQSYDITLHDAMEKYIEMKTNVLSPSTISGYKQISRLRFLDIQPLKINKLTLPQIQISINKESATLSAKTVSNASGFLSSVLKTFRPNFNYNATLPKIRRDIKEFPSIDDILFAINNTDVELAVLLAIWLTMRMSEVKGLRKCDISGDTITVNQVMLVVESKEIIRSLAKTTNSIRRLRIPPYIMRLINQLPSDQEYLVAESAQTVSKRFYRLLEKNNIPHIRFHDLRHLSASVMLELKIPDKYAMERGGWSTDKTLKKVYQHTFSNSRIDVDNMIDSYFETKLCNTKCSTE